MQKQTLKLQWLSTDTLDFPDVETALQEPNGLLAVGGDLGRERLLQAYRCGVFPWYEEDQPILWWAPNPRCVLKPDEIHISRSLRKALRRDNYRISADTAFEQVLTQCAAPRSYTADTWITTEMAMAYADLHAAGHAHSVEVWRDDQLVGGLYGISIGRMFFGESMFSTATDASKIAFAALAKQLQAWEFDLIDCQLSNPHLTSLGAYSIPRQEFTRLLTLQDAASSRTGPWTLSWAFQCKDDFQ